MEQMVRQFEERDGIEIKLNPAENLVPLFYDDEKMKRVVNNLLTNAVQAVTANFFSATLKRHCRRYKHPPPFKAILALIFVEPLGNKIQWRIS